MSVLHDVLNKMMTDFLSKEEGWKRYGDTRTIRTQPALFSLTLDSPEFRQLKKELNESRVTADGGGLLRYTRLVIDGVPFEASDPDDDYIRRCPYVNVVYPYPACTYVYSATIRHNCTLLPVPAPMPDPQLMPDLAADFSMTPARATGRSVPSARDRFLTEDAVMAQAGVPEQERPGYRPGSCACVDCRFSNYRVAMSLGTATTQDRDRLAGQVPDAAVIRLNDARPSTAAATAETLRRISFGRTR